MALNTEQDGEKVTITEEKRVSRVIALYHQLRRNCLSYDEALQLIYLDMLDHGSQGETPRIVGR